MPEPKQNLVIRNSGGLYVMKNDVGRIFTNEMNATHYKTMAEAKEALKWLKGRGCVRMKIVDLNAKGEEMIDVKLPRVWDKVSKEMMSPAKWEENTVGCSHKKIGLYIYRSQKDPRQHSALG